MVVARSWGGSGGAGSRATRPGAVLAGALVLLGSWPLPAPAASPHFNYLMHCGGCHNVNGEGSEPLVPRLRDTLGQIVALERGRNYLVRVPGAFQAPISDGELAALLNFVLYRFNAQSLPSDFTPFTAAEVAAYRAQPILMDPLRMRASLWQEERSAPGADAY